MTHQNVELMKELGYVYADQSGSNVLHYHSLKSDYYVLHSQDRDDGAAHTVVRPVRHAGGDGRIHCSEKGTLKLPDVLTALCPLYFLISNFSVQWMFLQLNSSWDGPIKQLLADADAWLCKRRTGTVRLRLVKFYLNVKMSCLSPHNRFDCHSV